MPVNTAPEQLEQFAELGKGISCGSVVPKAKTMSGKRVARGTRPDGRVGSSVGATYL
jgi:hypothetical protein